MNGGRGDSSLYLGACPSRADGAPVLPSISAKLIKLQTANHTVKDDAMPFFLVSTSSLNDTSVWNLKSLDVSPDHGQPFARKMNMNELGPGTRSGQEGRCL